MARIRSLHPGQSSDEDFVALSMEARVFCLLLRCHADDQGVFEWKPKTLKMTIFPADSIDVVPLLDELQDNRQVKRFDHGGKSYGAIRNFRFWQRPKKPTAIHPLPDELRTYVGLNGTSSPPVPPDDDTTDEPVAPQAGISPADGGDKMEEVVTTATPPAPFCELIAVFDQIRTDVFGENQSRLWPDATDSTTARKWIELGVDGEFCREVLTPKMLGMRAKGREPPATLSYFDKPIANAVAAKNQPLPEGNPNDDPLHIPDAFNRRKKPDPFDASVAAARRVIAGE